MTPYEKIKRIFVENEGIVKTADITSKGIHNQHISNLLAEGKIMRLKRGVYQWVEDGEKDEVEILVRLIPEAILCMESALYFHGYTERTPACWYIAVDRDSNKSRYRIEYPKIKPIYMDAKYLNIGMEAGKINETDVKVYCKERTICDVLRYANKLDPEIVNKAIQCFIKESNKDIGKLCEYAKVLRVYKKIQQWIGVWL